MDQVRATNLPVNTILVSDHGMSELKHLADTYIFLDELISTKQDIVIVNGGTQAHVYTASPQQRDSLYLKLSLRSGSYNILKREDFPKRWHYDHERSGDLLIQAKPGHFIVTGTQEKILSQSKTGSVFGVHGYDPAEVPDMYGIFYANGPNIRAGLKVPAFENIHVYPFIADILRLKIPAIDGQADILRPIRKK
jgi:alkaline phosphatase D